MASSSSPSGRTPFVDTTHTWQQFSAEYKFEAFIDYVKELLDNDEFGKLDLYFQQNHVEHKKTLETKKTLNAILEEHIKKPENIFKAVALLSLIRNNLTFTKAHKVQETLCQLLMGNDDYAISLISEMIDADQIISRKVKYFDEIMLLQVNYLADPRLAEAINQIKQIYQTLSIPAEGTSSSSASSLLPPHLHYV